MAQNRPPLNVAVLGATGAVGQRFVQLLQGHPWFRVAELVASDRSAGQRYGEAARWVLPGNPPPDLAERVVLPLDADVQSPLVFSALPAEIAQTVEWRLAETGHVVCSNASAYRMHEHVPILLPEINAPHAALVRVQRQKYGWGTGGLVTNSNCTSAPVAMAFAPLRPFGIVAAQLTSLQAVSGGGYPGVPSLDILDNVIPYIGGEEDKMVSEPLKLLGRLQEGRIQDAEIVISPHCNRVPVHDGHTECVSVSLDRRTTIEEISQVWRDFRAEPQALGLPSAPQHPILVAEEADRPQPSRDIHLEKGMATIVGRLRPCPLFDFKFVLLGHNTVRGAAGGSLLNAELLVAQGWIK